MASDGKVMPPVFFEKGKTVSAKIYFDRVLWKVFPWVGENSAPGQVIFFQNVTFCTAHARLRVHE